VRGCVPVLTAGVVYPSGPRSSQFSRGVKVSFLYPRLPYVGKLHQLRVGTDGSGLFAAWHLHRVEVTHVHTGESWLFECNAWLDRRNSWQLLLPAGGCVRALSCAVQLSAVCSQGWERE
jgi:hypothetical protein